MSNSYPSLLDVGDTVIKPTSKSFIQSIETQMEKKPDFFIELKIYMWIFLFIIIGCIFQNKKSGNNSVLATPAVGGYYY
jgi:hypothetical protein